MTAEFFLIAQKGMGEGHEMTIRTRGGEKIMEKGEREKVIKKGENINKTK